MQLPRVSAKCKVQSVKCKPTTNYQLSTLNYKVKAAFTLIELLVVITIIAILIGITTFSYTQAQKKGRDGKRKAELKAVQQALVLYFEENGKYPDTSSGQILCNSTGQTEGVRAWGTASFTCSTINFLDKLPKDPTSEVEYYYTTSGTPPLSYVISATLENTNDPDTTNLPCTPYAGPPARNYCVKDP